MRHSICFLITSIFLIPLDVEAKRNDPEMLLEKQAEKVLADPRFHSLSIGVVDGKKSYTGHFGELTIDESNKPTNKTLYEIGSVTKTMTGLLVADAVANNLLELDQDIVPLLAEKLNAHNNTQSSITIQQLLTHTSGLPRMDSNFDVDVKIETRKDLLEAVLNHDRSDKQGRYSYSNVGYEILGYVLSIIYQKPFDQILQERMKSLAGMSHTQVNLKPDQLANFAYGYDEKGQRAKAFIEPNSFSGSSGFIKSNMTDLVQYMKLQLNGANQVIKFSHQSLFEVTDSDAIAYAWIVASDDKLGRYLIHHGGMYGTQNWMIIFPDKQMAISIITNASFEEVGGILREAAFNLVLQLDEIKN